MKKYALIGRRLGHSYSQRWFTSLFARLQLDDHSYSLCEMPSVEGLRSWVKREGICGMNVTVPFKCDVIGQLDALDATAQAVGAVNCITVSHTPHGDGLHLTGHNTDAPAFAETLMAAAGSRWPTDNAPNPVPHFPASAFSQPFDALVLGTGGAARAVAYALETLGARPTLASRNPQKTAATGSRWPVIGYDDIQRLPSADFQLLVNATPVGMHPDVDRSPIDIATLHIHPSTLLVYDLVYNPSPTLLMRQAAAAGATVTDGLAMLHRQAELSWMLYSSE